MSCRNDRTPGSPATNAVATTGRRPDPEVTAEIAARYGLSFDLTEVPDLIARHGLSAR